MEMDEYLSIFYKIGKYWKKTSCTLFFLCTDLQKSRALSVHLKTHNDLRFSVGPYPHYHLSNVFSTNANTKWDSNPNTYSTLLWLIHPFPLFPKKRLHFFIFFILPSKHAHLSVLTAERSFKAPNKQGVEKSIFSDIFSNKIMFLSQSHKAMTVKWIKWWLQFSFCCSCRWKLNGSSANLDSTLYFFCVTRMVRFCKNKMTKKTVR